MKKVSEYKASSRDYVDSLKVIAKKQADRAKKREAAPPLPPAAPEGQS